MSGDQPRDENVGELISAAYALAARTGRSPREVTWLATHLAAQALRRSWTRPYDPDPTFGGFCDGGLL